MRELISCILVFAILPLWGQLPNTQLYLVEQVDSEFYVTWIDTDNQAGYNNQPQVIGPNDIYISRQKQEESESDVFSLNLQSGQMTRITNTLEAEYSPKLHPDGRSFTCVRIEQDGVSQHLWKFPLNRSSNGERMITGFDNIGYYQWINDDEIVLFLVNDPNTLILYNLDTETSRTISNNPGRALALDQDGDVVFIDIFNQDYRYIKRYDRSLSTDRIVVKIPNTCADFGLGIDGALYIGSGSQLMRYMAGKDVAWTMHADLSFAGIKNITRITPISENSWVIVDQKSE